MPAGWKTVALEGGEEEGYEGNGTWIHQRDPRYAAQDVITMGCAEVTRNDYTDPVAALEGNYQHQSGEPGVGLVLQFGTVSAARTYYAAYVRQVSQCTATDGPVLTKIIPSPTGLIDRRTYPDGKWTEMAALRGSRMTLIILADPAHSITTASAERVLAATTSG